MLNNASPEKTQDITTSPLSAVLTAQSHLTHSLQSLGAFFAPGRYSGWLIEQTFKIYDTKLTDVRNIHLLSLALFCNYMHVF